MVYGLNYVPELIGIGKYTSEMCEWLASRGHQVTVVTAFPHYPDWKVPPGFDNRRYVREESGGVHVRRCPLYVPKVPRGAVRILSQASYVVSSAPVALRHAWRHRPKVVMAIAPVLLSAAPALAAARLAGARTWLHIQDFEVDAAFELGMLKGERARRLAGAIESGLMRRFDTVSTISPRMAEGAARKGVAASRIVEFRNWVDTELIAPGDRMTGYRRELGLGVDDVVALYSGSMVAKQGLEHLVPVARRLASEQANIMFVLCGNGTMRAELMAGLEGLPNVRFLDLQPLARLPELLATADIHLLPQRAAIMDLVMPSKLPPMFASGRPVVAQAVTGTQVAREVEGRGLVVPPGDESELADAILRLADDAALRRSLGEAGRAHAADRWSREHILGELEARLERLAAEGSS